VDPKQRLERDANELRLVSTHLRKLAGLIKPGAAEHRDVSLFAEEAEDLEGRLRELALRIDRAPAPEHPGRTKRLLRWVWRRLEGAQER
jgi:hypothetical protein